MVRWNRNTVSPIGVHIGTRSVSLAQLTSDGQGRSVHALATAALPEGVDETDASQRDAVLAETLRELLASGGFRGRRAVSCLGPEELFVHNVRLPELPHDEVKKMVEWETEERLPYDSKEAEIRFLVAGEVRQDSNRKREVIWMACHRGTLQRHISVLERAGLEPVAIDAEPCAVVRGLADESETARQAFLHIGETATGVVFTEGTQILFFKYVPQGGVHFDQAIAEHLALPVSEAARMRRALAQCASLDLDNELHRSVATALNEPLAQLAQDMELCLRYFKVTFRGRPLERVLVSGSEACPWLVEFFSKRLHVPCELGDPFGRVQASHVAPELTQQRGRWAAPLGLSLKR